MRIVLTIILCLSLAILVLGLFQRSAEVARWSQIYGILGATGKSNPLEDENVRRRFDAIYWQDRSIIPALCISLGVFTSVFSIAALTIHTRDEHKRKDRT
jgi:hypothetical protein